MKYYLLLIFKVFFLLSLSAAISLFLTSFGIFGYPAFSKSKSLAEGIVSLTEFVGILNGFFNYSGFVIIFGFMFAWPAMYLLSFPYCLYLRFKGIEGFLMWVIPLTLIGFIYSFFLNYIFTNYSELKQTSSFWIIIFTSTAFITSIFNWIFCNKLPLTFSFGLSEPEENFNYYLIKCWLKIRSYNRNIIWPEISVFRHTDLYVAWRWLIVLFIVLSVCLYIVQSIYLITFPVTYGGLRKYIDWSLGFLFTPFALVIAAHFYIILLYCLSIILMSKKIKNLYTWVLSFLSLGVVYSVLSYLNNTGAEAELYRDLMFIFILLSFVTAFAMRYIYIKSRINIFKTERIKNDEF